MSAWRFVAILLAVLACAVPVTARANDGLWAKLKEGGRIALVRHAAAPGGPGDPANFKLDDCATQRNLSEKGRTDARRLGDAFRKFGISVGKVVSSQWCRCRETATLMALGPIESAPTFNNAYLLSARRDELTGGARAMIAAWRGPGVLVVATHGANILALTGVRPVEGAIVVVEPSPASDTHLRLLGQIVPNS